MQIESSQLKKELAEGMCYLFIQCIRAHQAYLSPNSSMPSPFDDEMLSHAQNCLA